MVAATIQTTVTGIQGYPVATLAPAANQALTWNGNAWAPACPVALSPLTIANGGTGAATAAAALSALGGLPRVRASRATIILGGQPSFASTSPIMGGWGNSGFVITPSVTGTVLFSLQSFIYNSLAGAATYWGLAYGSGTPPTQGSPATGTGLGQVAFVTGFADQTFPCICTGLATGLTLGTQYWFDARMQVLSGTMVCTAIAGSAVEI